MLHLANIVDTNTFHGSTVCSAAVSLLTNMPFSFRRLVKRLQPSPMGEEQAPVPKPFDPFDPIHDAPRQINLPDVLDQDVMISRLVDSVRQVELLPETYAVRSFDDLEKTPWTSFFGFCEACKQCIMSENPGLVGTLEWFNMAR